MIDRDLIREQCFQLSNRLRRSADWGELRAVYLDLVPVVGEIQGAVRTFSRSHSASAQSQVLDQAFEELQVTIRQVGHDIRLSSPEALRMGLEASLGQAQEILDLLQER